MADYIDTSVFLGMAFEEGNSSYNYLRTVGYKNHRKGIISEYVLGEILNNILTSIKEDNPKLEFENKVRALELIDEIITFKDRRGDLEVVNFSNEIDRDILDRLTDIDRELSYDDALHLCVAIQQECGFFVTTDKKLLKRSKVLEEFLSREFGLKLKEIII